MNVPSLHRCLASPTRLAMLRSLVDREEACVGDLVLETGAERTNVSHQLRELRACGLVSTRQEGKRVYYRLAHPRLAEFLDLAADLAEHIQCTDATECQAAGCC